MRKKGLLLFLACIFTAGSLAYGEVAFKSGGDLRLRNTYFKNIYTLDSNNKKDIRHYYRQRLRVWGEWGFDENISLFARLTNEFYAYYQPSEPFEINEVIFDNLYLDIKNILDLPLSLRVGRQDLKYGDGFIIWEGTPKDGSRTTYFDAVKLIWDINEDNSLDLILIKNDQKDQKLPRINDLSDDKSRGDHNLVGSRSVNASDENGIIAYLKSKLSEDLAAETFYVYKDAAPVTSKSIPEKKINAIGSLLKYKVNDSLNLRGLFTYEFGDYGPNDLRAWAAYVFADKAYKDATWSPVVTLGYLFASGDDLDSTKNEEFDPLFGRYVFPSSPYYYTCLVEGEPILGTWSNLHFFLVKVVVKPMDKMKAGLEFDYLRAPEKSSAAIHSDGKTKGYIPSTFISYDFSKNVNLRFDLFYMFPGSYYVDSADDALFTRLQMVIKY